MPVNPPPEDVQEAYFSSTVEFTRRVDIFKNDGVTLWGTVEGRGITGGNVDVNYDRDERRTIDVTFANTDRSLKPAANGFWYDKILKAYHGIKFNKRRAFVEGTINYYGNPLMDGDNSYATATAGDLEFSTDEFHSGTQSLKFTPDGTNDTNSVTFVAASGDGFPAYSSKPVAISLWMKVQAGGAPAGRTVKTQIEFYAVDDSLISTVDGWDFDTSSNDWQKGSQITVAPANTAYTKLNIVQTESDSDSTENDILFIQELQYELKDHITDLAVGDVDGVFWAGDPNESPSIREEVQEGTEVVQWECQIGEFMIDNISLDNFPSSVQVTGRDYTKKCMLSKFTQALIFAAGSSPESLVSAIAANCGIFKQILPSTGIVLGDLSFDANTSRWDAMKQIANNNGYELFFDAMGYLVMRSFNDPTTSPTVWTYKTGEPDGNIVKFTRKISDALIFNHVAVTGASGDSGIPIFVEVFNNLPGSPTNVVTLGDRLFPYQSDVITDVTQAYQVAYQLLAVQGLESYEIDMEVLVFPWLEAGDIINFIDPDPETGDPIRYLLTGFPIPLSLGTSTITVKRATLVGSGTQ